MTEFDYDMKRKLANKINKIKDKKTLLSIIHIIKATNPNIKIVENDHGMLIKFNLLSPETYVNLDNYLRNNVSKKLTEATEQTTSLCQEYTPYVNDEFANLETKYKLSNRERTLLKKQKYTENIVDHAI